MDATYCREHAQMCRNSVLGIADGDQSEWWFYLAHLWDELAATKEPAEQLPTLH